METNGLWVWLIGFLVLSMMLGPVMLMQPSRSQREQASLRALALRQGLQVSASQVESADEIRCWCYAHPVPAGRRLQPFSLTRKTYSHGLHLADCWALEQGDLEDAQRAALAPWLKSLPASVWGLSSNGTQLGLHWTEQGGEAQLMKLMLWLDEALLQAETSLPWQREDSN